MSTFSTRGGLYERAQKRFGVSDGKRLFTYAFFEKQRLEALVRLNSGFLLCAGSAITSKAWGKCAGPICQCAGCQMHCRLSAA